MICLFFHIQSTVKLIDKQSNSSTIASYVQTHQFCLSSIKRITENEKKKKNETKYKEWKSKETRYCSKI